MTTHARPGVASHVALSNVDIACVLCRQVGRRFRCLSPHTDRTITATL